MPNKGEIEQRPAGPTPTFVSFLADTWRVARIRILPLLALFALVNLVGAGIILAILEALDPTDEVRLMIESSGLALDTVLAGCAAIWAARLWVADKAEEEIPFGAGRAAVGRRLGSLIGCCFVTGLVIVVLYIGLGTQGLLVLGFMLAVPLTVGPPILLHTVGLENRSLREATARARRLIKGNAIRTFVYLLMVGLLVTLISGVLLSLVGTGVVQTGLAGGSLTIVGLALSSVFLGVTDLILAAGLLSAYLDVRERTEAFDIAELAAAASGEGHDEAAEEEGA